MKFGQTHHVECLYCQNDALHNPDVRLTGLPSAAAAGFDEDAIEWQLLLRSLYRRQEQGRYLYRILNSTRLRLALDGEEHNNSSEFIAIPPGEEILPVVAQVDNHRAGVSSVSRPNVL